MKKLQTYDASDRLLRALSKDKKVVDSELKKDNLETEERAALKRMSKSLDSFYSKVYNAVDHLDQISMYKSYASAPKAVKADGRFESDDVEQAKRYLQAVVILDGEGSIELGDRDDVWIAIVHDGSGYSPGAAVVTNQNRYHDSPDIPLQAAYEILQEKSMEDEENVKELVDEWGEEWETILTETFDGMVFGPFKPEVAAEIISSDKYASKYIDIYEAEAEEEDYNYKKVEADRHSDSAREAKQYLRRLDILDAMGDIIPTRRGEVWIGLAIDEYNNQATLVVDQGRSPDRALNEARSLLGEYWIAYEAEIPEGDIKDIAFGPFDPATAADIIRSLSKSVATQINIYER